MNKIFIYVALIIVVSFVSVKLILEARSTNKIHIKILAILVCVFDAVSTLMTVNGFFDHGEKNYSAASGYIMKAANAKQSTDVNSYLRRAVSELEKVVEKDSSNCDAHLNLGLVYWTLGEEEDANKSMGESVECDPINPLPKYHLALFKNRHQAFSEATKRLFVAALNNGLKKKFEDKGQAFCNVIAHENLLDAAWEQEAFLATIEEHLPGCAKAQYNHLNTLPMDIDVANGFWFITFRQRTIQNDQPPPPQVDDCLHIEANTYSLENNIYEELRGYVAKYNGKFLKTGEESAEIRLATSYCIQHDEVTVREFKRFLGEQVDTSYKSRADQLKSLLDEIQDNYPVQAISKVDAEHYAQWFSQKSGHQWSLPSLEQWVVAVALHAEQDPMFNSQDHKPEAIAKAKLNVASHLLGNLSEWSTESCGEGRFLLLGKSYLYGEAASDSQTYCQLESIGTPGIGFRLVTYGK